MTLLGSLLSTALELFGDLRAVVVIVLVVGVLVYAVASTLISRKAPKP